MADEQKPKTGNQNIPDPNEAAKDAHAAKGLPKTLAIYKILHEGVGPYAHGDIRSADELGGEENLPRLFALGAIAVALGK